jgi:hypothetical protein
MEAGPRRQVAYDADTGRQEYLSTLADGAQAHLRRILAVRKHMKQILANRRTLDTDNGN